MNPLPPETTVIGPNPATLPPPHVPDHELLRRIGRGAYGEVWLARSLTGALRAVKVVHRRSFDHERPFEREFEGILKFEPISRQHDSQVDILHVGRGEDCFFYVMELGDDQATGGQINPANYAPRTLKSELLFHGRLPFEECVRIGIALATALENLHANGLVHRDVKPSNIIFVNGVPKLADIGLVTSVDATRSYVGTEGFAAPEGPGTPQADIFSLGKVLYEIATGKDRQEFPELPTRLRELPDRDGLLELNAVITRACRHAPKDRYSSAAAMRADLELLQGGKSLARLRRAENRLRIVRRAGAVVTALAAMAVIAFWFQSVQTRRARNLATHNRLIAEENRRLANENRERVLQFHIAEGIREMDRGDFGRAMTWWVQGLKHATNNAHEHEMLRFRISTLLQMHPAPRAMERFSVPTNMARLFAIPSGKGEIMVFVTDTGMEWWRISFAPQLITRIPDHTNWSGMSLSYDGRQLVLAASSRAPQLWTVTPQGVAMTNLAAPPVKFLAITSSSNLVAVDTNGALVLLDLSRGGSQRELRRFDAPIESLGLSLNPSRVAVMLSNRMVHLLDSLSGEESIKVRIGDRTVSPRLDARGRFLVSVPPPSVPYPCVWDLAAGEKLDFSERHQEQIYCLDKSPDSRWLATGSRDRTARVWNLQTGDAVTPPLAHETSVHALAFSPDGQRLATADRYCARVWSVDSGRPLTPPLRSAARLAFVSFAMDGAALVTADAAGMIRVWDLTALDSGQTTLSLPGTVQSHGFSHNGELLLTHYGNESQVWRVRDWQSLCTIQHGWGAGLGTAFSPDSQYVAINEGWKGTRVWHAYTGKLASALLITSTNAAGQRSVRPWNVAFASDGELLALAGIENDVHLWNWKKGKEISPPFSHSGEVCSLALSSNGNRLLTKTVQNNTVRTWLWDVPGHSVLLKGPRQDPAQLGAMLPTFSPDGSRWLMSEPAVVHVMNSQDGKRLLTLRHDNTVLRARFSPDGRHIVTASMDLTVRIWNASNGTLVVPPIPHDKFVNQAQFSADGTRLLTFSGYEVARLWDALTGAPLTPWIPVEVQSARPTLHPSGNLIAMNAHAQRVIVRDLALDIPTPLLEDWVTLVSGQKLGSAGALVSLESDAMFELHHRLRRQSSASFEPPAEALARWHERQIHAAPLLSQVESSLFHLNALQALQPTNTSLAQRRASLESRRVPPRPQNTPVRLIDLTDYYTASHRTLSRRQELKELPPGIHRLADTDFDLRGLVFFSAPNGPSRISRIPVRQRCRRLYFLHAATNSRSVEGDETARIIIHYVDGSQRLQPLIFGRDLRGWSPSPRDPVKASKAVVAWEGRAAEVPDQDAIVRLYKTVWDNPSPDVEISHLEIQIGDLLSQYVLAAITAE